jgi:hypothetical protein
VRRSDLVQAEREAMLRLLGAHFEGVTRATFERDLREKNWVLLLEDQGRLRGFSTLLLYETCHAGATLTVVYSGDTLVEPEAWGSAALARSWIGSIQALRRLHPRGSLYWLLLASGFRTYRFLPVFWREFHPRFDALPAPDELALRSALTRERFGSRYRPELGIVRLDAPQVLRGELAHVPAPRRADPHVAFFLERNPGWTRGDELVCLTEIAEHNLTAAGRRMWREGERALELPPGVA